MKKIITTVFVLAIVTIIHAATISIAVKDTRKQTITGFGAASCDGAMKPFGTDTQPARLLYGDESKIGLNIMRMEISPSFTGDNWGDYDWNGSLPSARIVKQRGGIVFGTPWSPPGEYKTNGTAQGGNSDSQGKKRGKLREDCYDKFFPWLNTFLKWMKSKGVTVDAVSIQNEPDWWVDYSGCLYDPADLVKLVKNYAYMLDRETYSGVKLISGESLGFTQNYTDPLMNDPTCREQIDIVAGHLYGHAPLNYMKYIYWYMRAHWAFVGTGETKYNVGDMKNTKNKLLPRAYVMSHFSKHVTGSTRLVTSRDMTSGEGATHEYSAYIKGDSLIVMAIDTTKNGVDLKILLPYQVKSGTHLLSTGNEPENLCQESPIAIDEPTKEVIVPMPARSLNTYIFMIDKGSTAIEERAVDTDDTKVYYDIHGRRLDAPKGLCIEKSADGSSRKVYLGR